MWFAVKTFYPFNSQDPMLSAAIALMFKFYNTDIKYMQQTQRQAYDHINNSRTEGWTWLQPTK